MTRAWGRTFRFDIAAEDEARLRDVSEPTILVFWHCWLFLAAECHRRYRPDRRTYGLISASKDGAWLAAFIDLIGLESVRGSSSRRGREALQELRSLLAEGNDVALTPDGPRGPRFSFKPGAAILARRSATRLLLVGAQCPAAWKANSWDEFRVPRPFARVSLRTRFVDPAELPDDLGACTEELRRLLLDLDGGSL